MKYVLLSVFILSPAFAAKPMFTLMVKRKYDKVWYKVIQDGKKWVCETTHFPYFEAKENPLDNLDWSKLVAESKKVPKPCTNIVGMENTLKGKPQRIVTCLVQPETLAVYTRIVDQCASKI